MVEFVRFRGRTRAEAIGLVRSVLRGVLASDAAIAETVLLPGALALLSKIQEAFIVKSRGGTDAAGIKWEPLKRETIARRRIGPGDLAAIGVKGAKIPANRTRGLLTPKEDRTWRSIFASRLAAFRARGFVEGEARSRAAQIAWATLKAQGAKTKLDVLGGRTVDIGRDTGILFRSLTPGLESDSEQVCEAEPGRITVGSNVPYAGPFHARRRLWPDHELPEAWNAALAAAVARGLVRAVASSAERGAA